MVLNRGPGTVFCLAKLNCRDGLVALETFRMFAFILPIITGIVYLTARAQNGLCRTPFSAAREQFRCLLFRHCAVADRDVSDVEAVDSAAQRDFLALPQIDKLIGVTILKMAVHTTHWEKSALS